MSDPLPPLKQHGLPGMPPPPAFPQQQTRAFGDINALRDNIFNEALRSASSIEPIQNDLYTLKLTGVGYTGPERYTRKDQKKAVLTRGSLARKLTGTWTLIENGSEKPVATRQATIANVPYLTDSGTFVNKGVEYTLAHQLRLRPGVFTREKDNGELESHVNTLPGRGRSHRYYMDPKTGEFQIQIGQAKIPLMPLLKTLGVSDKQVREAWGNEITAVNIQKGDAGTLDKLYSRLVFKPDPAADQLAKIKAIAAEFAKTELDEEVTKRTLGKPYKNLTPDAILDITKKLIAVNRKEADSDDRDSMTFQQVFGPEDLISERFVKDKSGLRQLLWKATAKKSLDHIPSGVFNKSITAALIGSGLGSCFDDKTLVLTRRGFVAWPSVTEDDEFACDINGKLEYHRAYRIVRQNYTGPLLGCKTKRLNYLVTPNHRLWCKAKDIGEYREERADAAHGRTRIFQTSLPPKDGVDADFVLPPVINARWGKSTEPLAIPGDKWAEFLGWYMAEGWVSDEVANKTGGRRLRVCLSQCAAANPAGHADIVQILSAMPFRWTYNASNKTFFITSKQLAAELLKYGKGSKEKRLPRYCFDWSARRLRLLAEAYLHGDGNEYRGYIKAETVSPRLAEDIVELFGRLGRTGRISTRLLSARNPRWADSYVISCGTGNETRATSDKENLRINKLAAYYSQHYSGVVYCATVPGEKLYVMRGGKPHWSLNSLEEINPAEIFDHQTRVTRLGEGGIGSLDAVPAESRSVQPSHFGFIDYLRTPECYDAETEVMTRIGWKKWPDVTAADEFACLLDSGELDFCRALELHAAHYAGIMYGADTGKINYLVTPNHRMWTRPLYAGAPYRFESAPAAHLKFRGVLSGGFDAYAGDDATIFVVPQPEYDSNNRSVVDAVDIADWAELLGWYLGEGSCVYRADTPQYHVKITQCEKHNPENCDQIRALLNKLPFKWSYHGKAFTLATKQVAAYFKQFNGSTGRWIPEEFLRAPREARLRLFDALMKSEGRKNKRGERTNFCTSSQQLARDFERLAFGLGYSSRTVFEKDNRPQSSTGGCWIVHVHKQNSHQVLPRATVGGRCHYFTQQYSGMVYCATVPGGLLYVRRHGSCGFWCGNSGKVGVDMRFAAGARKLGNNLHTFVVPVKNANTGQTEYKTPQELADMPLMFPGEDKSDLPMVAALVNGKIKYVPRKDAQYTVPNMDNTFSALTNMVPMKSMVKGQRVIMGSRMFTQALSLENAEAPFVQSEKADTPGVSHEDEMGEKLGAIKSQFAGQVVSVTPDEMVLRDKDGNKHTIDLYNEMPFNRKSFWTQTPTVKPGDTVQPGQLIATSNFTDKNGTAALGLNLRVGYAPFRGRNYEDAVVISESAAKKLTSQHMYQHEAEWDDNTHVGKKAFMSLFPSEYDKKMLERFDDNGAVKKGMTVNFGDPLVLVAKKRDQVYGKVHRGRAGAFANETITWDHHSPGIVTDVEHTKKGVSVVVKSQSQMEIGDKITGRFGDKGVVSEIVPDHQMPQDSQGRPLEILVSPLGLISRVNPAQIIEAALGKVAEKTGQPFKIKDFDNDNDLIEMATKELAKHGLSDTEDLVDPETGRKIRGILTGNRFFMKLHHTAESKGQGRSIGGYTAEGTPAKGGTEGAKRVGMLELGALLSHGAGKVVRDAKMVRGQANPEYWTQFMAGYDPPLPKVPHVYEKFVNQLRGSGVNVVRTGTKTHIMALTDKNIDELAGEREIQNSETVDWKGNLKPVNGGLFDENLTGGHGGNRWAKITLHEPMPNPVMEEPIRRTLGLTEKKFRAVLAGQDTLNDKTGPTAIHDALKAINVPRAIEQAREDIKSGRKTLRDAAVRKLAFLKGAEAAGVHPRDWMQTKVGVLPPAFRPVSTMGAKKMQLIDDANYLYKELLESNNVLKEASGLLSDVGNERLSLYDSMKAVSGLGDPQHPKNVERNVRGFLSKIFGDSPKFGTMQRKLLSSTADLVGRAVISPNPDLDMDEVALPEDKAWDIYKPFIVRGLVRRGMPRMNAMRAVEERNKEAFAELNTQMNSKPIVINRAPVLHRYGVMAFYPRLTKNKVMEVNPVITKGFNADFDGDAMQYHVPSTEEAAQEAVEKMLPSKNLFAAANFKAHYVPNKDYQTGVYLASSKVNNKSKPRVYRTKKDAMAAYRRGDIDVDTPVHIVEDKA